MEPQEKRKVTIPLEILIPCIVAIIAGTYAVTRYISNERIETLKTIVQEKADKIESIREKKESESIIPSERIAENSDDPEIKDLALRIEELETQKRALVSKISEKAVASLDPLSEVSNLLSELQNKDSETIGKVIDSLFKFHDPILFKPMLEFFINNRELATAGYNPSPASWYEYFIKIDEESGLHFVIKELANPDRNDAQRVYTVLKYEVDTIKKIDISIPILEELSLSSSQSSVRANAKILLTMLKQRREKLVSEEEARVKTEEEHARITEAMNNRPSIYELLETILSEIQELKGRKE